MVAAEINGLNFQMGAYGLYNPFVSLVNTFALKGTEISTFLICMWAKCFSGRENHFLTTNVSDLKMLIELKTNIFHIQMVVTED